MWKFKWSITRIHATSYDYLLDIFQKKNAHTETHPEYQFKTRFMIKEMISNTLFRRVAAEALCLRRAMKAAGAQWRMRRVYPPDPTGSSCSGHRNGKRRLQTSLQEGGDSAHHQNSGRLLNLDCVDLVGRWRLITFCHFTLENVTFCGDNICWTYGIEYLRDFN